MSGPQGSDPTRPWSPPSDAPQPGQPPAAEEATTATPWWQQVTRHRPATPSHPPQPQSPPYPQQPAPQSSYSPPQHGQQPGGVAPAEAAAQPTHTKRWLLIGGGILVGAIAAVVLALVLLQMDVFNRQVLNVNKAQVGVKQVITDPVTGYGIDNVTTVTCNGGKNPSANKGDTFTCAVTVDGKKREVRVVFIDDKGTYEVDRPR